MSINKFAEYWNIIEKGDEPISYRMIAEMAQIRMEMDTEVLGVFFFNRGCYDTALQLFNQLESKDKLDALIKTCEHRLYPKPQNKELPILDLDKIRPGLKERLSLGEKNPLGEARIGWLKNERWSVYSLSGINIIDNLISVSPFHNGMSTVKLNNGESIVINRHGNSLKILNDGSKKTNDH